MKVKVVGYEMIDPEIEKISLVKHGANRVPFRILKSEDMPKEAVSKDFGMSMTTDYEENVNQASFFPCLSAAVSTFGDTTWNVLGASSTASEAEEKMESVLSAFVKHVKGLLKSLPATVFRPPVPVEEGLRKDFGGSTVTEVVTKIDSAVESTTTNGASDMKLKEVVSGDLQDLLVEKTDVVVEAEAPVVEVVVEKVKPADEAPVVKMLTGKKKYKKGEEVVEQDYEYFVENNEEIFVRWIEKDEAAPEPVVEKADPMLAIVNQLAAMTALIQKQGDALDKRLAAVEKAEDKPTPSKTVVQVTRSNLDESLANMYRGDRKVAKSDSDDGVWAGSALDVFTSR